MQGNCEDCARRESCNKEIGKIFGFCKNGFVPVLDPEREDELFSEWKYETEDEETQAWRDGLTEAEQAVVEYWDSGYNRGILELCEKILALESKR